MKLLWNQWTRKHDGWAERRRRLQKLFTEKAREAAGLKDPAVANITLPETRVSVRNRGER